MGAGVNEKAEINQLLDHLQERQTQIVGTKVINYLRNTRIILHSLPINYNICATIFPSYYRPQLQIHHRFGPPCLTFNNLEFNSSVQLPVFIRIVWNHRLGLTITL